MSTASPTHDCHTKLVLLAASWHFAMAQMKVIKEFDRHHLRLSHLEGHCERSRYGKVGKRGVCQSNSIGYAFVAVCVAASAHVLRYRGVPCINHFCPCRPMSTFRQPGRNSTTSDYAMRLWGVPEETRLSIHCPL
eukprot:568094-Amphidinium_carterae.1